MMKSANLSFMLFLGLTTFLFGGCDKKETTNDKKRLVQTKEIRLDVAEPSGMSMALQSGCFWIAGDASGLIQCVDTMGNVLNSINLDMTGIEGIAYRNIDNSLYLLLEEVSQIVKISLSGTELQRWDIDLGGGGNKGPEGIVWDSVKSTFWLVNEGAPGVLAQWLPETGVTNIRSLNFATDYSDVTTDPSGNGLWIVSDETANVTHISYAGEVLESYKHELDKAEGVVLTPNTNEVWFVSDSKRKLYQFKFKTGE
jgi:uncharacterized protein YjiK